MNANTLTARRAAYLKNLKLDGEIIWTVSGPRGGRTNNAIGTPSAGWTRAAHLAGYMSVAYWSGSKPTPSRRFAPDVVDAMVNAPAELR